MCEHPREPIYNAKYYRIISRPNGYWQLQKHCDKPGSKTFDPWVNVGHKCSLREAYLQLAASA